MNTAAGKQAEKDCSEFNNRPDVYQGCLEDIKVTGSVALARQGALAEEEFRSKSKVSTSKKFCVASGDPHFTNYDGDFFHLQEKGIFTLMRADGIEIQEKVRKNGADKPGVPCCIVGLAIRYQNALTLEIDVENYKTIIVNGVKTTLEPDFTMKIGGVDVRYGKQSVEWRAESYKTNGIKFGFPNGFGVMVFGGYCGVVEVNAPAEYFGKVYGLCGNADGKRDANDFMSPEGSVMNVNYGQRKWEMSGYNGPTSALSKWQLAWFPKGNDCFFQSGCPAGPKPVVTATSTKASVISPKVSPVPVTAPVTNPTSSTQAVSSALSKSSKSSKSSKASKSSKSSNATVPLEQVIRKEIVDSIPETNHKLTTLKEKLVSIMTEMERSDKKLELESQANYNKVDDDIRVERLRIAASHKTISSLYTEITKLNTTIQVHYRTLISDTDYIKSLDEMRPGFMKSLDELTSHIDAIKTVVNNRIINDEYKDEMLHHLTSIRFNAHNISGYVATAFINHYNKFKARIQAESVEYTARLKKLSELSTEYQLQQKKMTELEGERSRLEAILVKLKVTLTTSQTSQTEFEAMFKEILALFDKNTKKNRC